MRTTRPEELAPDASVPPPNHTLDRGDIDAAARTFHPKGIAGLPSMIAMWCGMESVPPELHALVAPLADHSTPIRIAITAGDAPAFVVEIR